MNNCKQCGEKPIYIYQDTLSFPHTVYHYPERELCTNKFCWHDVTKEKSISKEEFIKSRGDLMQWVNDPFEKRAFLYLDLISWLDSKIEKRPVQEVIMEKARKNK